MADSEQLALLKRSVQEWNEWFNEWRIVNLGDKPNLIRANLSRANLRGADLSGVNLLGAKLLGADLSYADLSYANLSGANLYEARLNEADLRGVNLNEADLRGVNLRRVNLSGANLRRANLSRVDLSGADVKGSDVKGANLSGANLSGANLRRANLIRVDLSGADVKGSDLEGANLSGANLIRVDLKGVYIDMFTLFRYADLRGAVFSESDLKDADLTGAKRGPLPSKDVPDKSHTNQSSFSPSDWVNFVGTYGVALLTFVANVGSVIQGLDVVERRWREHKEKQPSSGQKSAIHKVLDSEITHIQLVMDDGSLHSFEKWVSDPDTLKEYIDAFNDPASKVKPLEVIFKKHKGRSLSVNVTEGGKDNLQLNVILGYINSDPQK